MTLAQFVVMAVVGAISLGLGVPVKDLRYAIPMWLAKRKAKKLLAEKHEAWIESLVKRSMEPEENRGPEGAD